VFLTRVVAGRIPTPLLSVFVRNAELLKFLTVGSIAFITTSVLFFGLKWTILDGKPVTANVVAVLIATVLSYVLNREWAFTARGGRERRHEAALFFVVAGVGLVITSCRWPFHGMYSLFRHRTCRSLWRTLPTSSVPPSSVPSSPPCFVGGRCASSFFRILLFHNR
jgi:putative flippase GtrA